ncbi:MAG: hypothetical protein DI628_08175 [Blastochloris viridis]|uniref:Uncharacterized protein n=1 Tax=Blastochloris viridis TaxID=1079 RepID=A0A6N4R0C0_BLAVI|nr:MAG: hypothetical protein DI628_08175 [Blastochloris viridis]
MQHILLLSSTRQREANLMERLFEEYAIHDAQGQRLSAPSIVFCNTETRARDLLLALMEFDLVIADDLDEGSTINMYKFMRGQEPLGADTNFPYYRAAAPKMKNMKFQFVTLDNDVWIYFRYAILGKDPNAALIGNRKDVPLTFEPNTSYEVYKKQRTLLAELHH